MKIADGNRRRATEWQTREFKSFNGQMPKDAKSMMQPYCKHAWIDISAASLLMLQQLVFLLQVLTRLQEAYGNLRLPRVMIKHRAPLWISLQSHKYRIHMNSFYEALEVQKHLSFCSKVCANLTCLGHLLLQRLHVFHHHLLLLKTQCHCVSK